MKLRIAFILLLGGIGLDLNGYAAEPALTDLSQDDVSGIVTDFSANFVHPSMSGASRLKGIIPLIGLEAGVVGGFTTTGTLDRVSPNKNVKRIPHGGLYFGVGLPIFGLGVEYVTFPQRTLFDITFKHQSAALKWTITDVILRFLPINIAARAHYATTKVKWNQTSDAADVSIDYRNEVYGLNFMASIDLWVVEPYIGFGWVKGFGDIEVLGRGTIFDYTTNQQASAKVSGIQTITGFEVNLLFLGFALEWGTAFGQSRYTAKVSLAI